VLELASEPFAVEAVAPERTRSVRCRVHSLALLGSRAIKAATGGGILLLRHTRFLVRGRRMRPATKRAPDAFGPADGRVMAPLHAPSALSGTGPGGSAPDLTVTAVDDDLLTNEVPGITTRN
jgi:hypothetical protein